MASQSGSQPWDLQGLPLAAGAMAGAEDSDGADA